LRFSAPTRTLRKPKTTNTCIYNLKADGTHNKQQLPARQTNYITTTTQQQYTKQDALTKLQVIYRHGGDIVVNEVLLFTLERLVRNLCSYHARHYSVWLGGYYHVAKALSDDPNDINAFVAWADNYFRRVSAYSELIRDLRHLRAKAVKNFDDLFLWYQGAFLLQVLAHVRTHGCVTGALRKRLTHAFGTVAHEKPVEDMFKVSRIT
jgi:hypothetical protein